MARKLTDEKTLKYMGDKAQKQLLKVFVEDPDTFRTVSSYINENFFDEGPIRELAKMIIEYNNSHDVSITYRDIEMLIKNKVINVNDLTLYRDLYNEIKDPQLREGIETTKEVCISKIKEIEMLRVLENATTLVKDKGYSLDRLTRVLDQLGNINRNTNLTAVSPADLFDRIMDASDIELIPTMIPELDNALNGGMPRGSLGLLVAGTGFGKTTLSSILCYNAAYAGFNVLQIVFEDSVEEIGQKHYAHITGRYTTEFSNRSQKEALKGEIFSDPGAKEAITKHLKILSLGVGTVNVDDIANTIKDYTNLGWKPDMVFIDYMSCLKMTGYSKNDTEFSILEKEMRKLEYIARSKDMVIWAIQQTNRDGVKVDTASNRLGNVQGSFRMTQPAGFALYLHRASEGDDFNKINLYLDKNRRGPRMVWENAYMNNGTCQIDLSEAIRNNNNLTFTDDGTSGYFPQ